MDTNIRNGVESLNYDAIEGVYAVDAPESAKYAGQYDERAMGYMIKLVGETKRRRVYAKPIGNVSVIYIKTKGKIVYCESAMDAAFHRAGA